MHLLKRRVVIEFPVSASIRAGARGGDGALVNLARNYNM
jgi:hypothetical protein